MRNIYKVILFFGLNALGACTDSAQTEKTAMAAKVKQDSIEAAMPSTDPVDHKLAFGMYSQAVVDSAIAAQKGIHPNRQMPVAFVVKDTAGHCHAVTKVTSDRAVRNQYEEQHPDMNWLWVNNDAVVDEISARQAKGKTQRMLQQQLAKNDCLLPGSYLIMPAGHPPGRDNERDEDGKIINPNAPVFDPPRKLQGPGAY